MGLKDYLALLRFKYHYNFISVVIGAIFFTKLPFYLILKQLLILYFSHTLLLYGGLYTINGIADIDSDARHSLKKNRPLPSKKVSVKSAWIFAMILIILGLVVAYFYFGILIFYMHLIFLILNLFYTFFAKKIPYMELVFNSITHPLRFFLGILLGSNHMPYSLVFAVFFLAFGCATSRRIVEKEAEYSGVRPTLRHYKFKQLNLMIWISFVLIVLLSIADYPLYVNWYIFLCFIYFIFAIGVIFSDRIKSVYKWMW